MDSNDEIAKVAYELFERDGRQHGKDREHWIEAERIVKARRKEREAAGDRLVAPPKKAVAKTGAAVKTKEKTPKSGEAGTAKQPKKPSKTPRSK